MERKRKKLENMKKTTERRRNNMERMKNENIFKKLQNKRKGGLKEKIWQKKKIKYIREEER